MIFTMADILRFPATSRIHFLECSGNTQNWGKPDHALTVQDTHGLLSCCEWTGVLLKTVLDARRRDRGSNPMQDDRPSFALKSTSRREILTGAAGLAVGVRSQARWMLAEGPTRLR